MNTMQGLAVKYSPNGQQCPPSLVEYEPHRITDLTDIPEPRPIVTIGGETIAVAQEITVFSGAPKSGKSALCNIVISQAVSPSGIISDNLEGLEVIRNIDGWAVIHFDTEQARHKHQRNINNILRRANLATCPDYFLSYNLRLLPIDKYAEIASKICEAAFLRFGNIHSIYIDGGADFIKDVNDAEAANEAIKFFESLAINYNTAVFIIIHTNPGSDKERGHMGSQAQRKAGSVLLVKESEGISYIEPKLLRYAGSNDIPLLQFSYDKQKGYHVFHGIKEKPQRDELRLGQSQRILSEVFKETGTALGYADLVNQVMRAGKVKERTAKDIIKTMNAYEMILQGSDKFYRLNLSYENQ